MHFCIAVYIKFQNPGYWNKTQTQKIVVDKILADDLFSGIDQGISETSSKTARNGFNSFWYWEIVLEGSINMKSEFVRDTHSIPFTRNLTAEYVGETRNHVKPGNICCLIRFHPYTIRPVSGRRGRQSSGKGLMVSINDLPFPAFESPNAPRRGELRAGGWVCARMMRRILWAIAKLGLQGWSDGEMTSAFAKWQTGLKKWALTVQQPPSGNAASEEGKKTAVFKFCAEFRKYWTSRPSMELVLRTYGVPLQHVITARGFVALQRRGTAARRALRASPASRWQGCQHHTPMPVMLAVEEWDRGLLLAGPGGQPQGRLGP